MKPHTPPAHELELLFREVEETLRPMPALLDLELPLATVIGDIHGDWHSYRSAMDRREGSIVFLGDIVDRGQHSVEVLTSIFHMLLRSPGEVFLLRGNHETREVNQRWGFKEELLTKYGEKHGPFLWAQANRVFDQLPLCAVLNRSFFLAHGGISEGIARVGDLRRTRKEVRGKAEGLIWNDTQEGAQRYRYVPNTYRGRGYRYSDQAAAEFCDVSGLQAIIRGHEWTREGARWNRNNRVLTVFSHIAYRGGNPGAIAIVKGRKVSTQIYV